jgi:hypothetical protein
MFLTPDEIVTLTRRDRPSGQKRVLDALGIPYRVHPVDRTLIVSRAVVEAALGGDAIEGQPAAEVYEVDVEGIRNHGKTAPAH